MLSRSSLDVSSTANVVLAQRVTIENVDVVHIICFVWFGGMKRRIRKT